MTSEPAETAAPAQAEAEEQLVETTSTPRTIESVGAEIKTSSGATLAVKKSEPGDIPVSSGPSGDDDDDWLQAKINETNDKTKKAATAGAEA